MNEDAVRLWIRRAESDLTQIEWGVHTLTKYAVGVRYDEEIFPSLDETKQAMELAERVTNFVLNKLRERGFEP